MDTIFGIENVGGFNRRGGEKMILYIHIPFCSSKCGYCAFHSSSTHFDLQKEYVGALIEDIKASLGGQKYLLKSVYFGGGTPNTLGVEAYEKIFEVIYQNAKIDKNAEITLECNPNLIGKEWVRGVRELGANRISLGVQSFENQKLEFLQRDHRSYDIFRSIEMIAKEGIEDISLDLIYGTPFDTLEFLQKEVDCLVGLPLSHLSAYTLSIDQGSLFYANPPSLPSVDYAKEFCEMLFDVGFTQYEVSNFYFSKKSSHNLAYWSAEEYIGCGSGAVGYQNGVRYSGIRSIPSYIKHPLRKHKEILKEEDIRLERLFLGLRCERGVDLKEVNPAKAKILLEEGKCYCKDHRLIACDYFIADEIALWLLE